MGFWAVFIGVLFLVVCILLILIVLLQKGKGGGLGAAFGGAGSSAFGTKTGDVFTWVTIVLTGLFLLLAVVASLLFRTPPDTVAPPTFNPSSGSVRDRTTVNLRCPTPNSSIRYTTDGSDPDEDSPVYDNRPIRVDPPMTVKARAYRTDWTPSAIVTALYTPIDANQPIGPPDVPTPPDANQPIEIPHVPGLPDVPAVPDSNQPPPATAPATAPAE